MFHKVNAKQFKRRLLFKYFFQFFLFPLIFGTIANIIVFIALLLFWKKDALYRFFVDEPSYLGLYGLAALTILVNIFSVITAIKLIIDKDKNIVEKEIKVTTVFPLIELLGWNESKRFMIDSYSKKKMRKPIYLRERMGKENAIAHFCMRIGATLRSFMSL